MTTALQLPGHALRHAFTRGAMFGLKASLTVFGTVFISVYGLYGGATGVLWAIRGRDAALRFIDDEGGLKPLVVESCYSAANVLVLAACCTLLSAVMFAIASWLSSETTVESAMHPLDRA